MSLKKCNILTYFSPSVAMMYFQSRLMIILTLGPTSHSLASQATGSLFSLSLLHIFWRIGAQLKKTKLVVVEQKRTSLSVCNSYSEWAKILKLSIRFNWTQLDSKRLSWTQRDATLLSPLTLMQPFFISLFFHLQPTLRMYHRVNKEFQSRGEREVVKAQQKNLSI